MDNALLLESRPTRLFWYFSTPLGMKALMAASGAAMFSFLLAHLIGNLLVFAGRERMDHYSEFLHSMPNVLWAARFGLLAAIGAHIWSAASLTKKKIEARPIHYKIRKNRSSSYASRNMIWTGSWIAGFVVFHIAHFTTGSLHGQYQSLKPFENVVYSFRSPIVSLAYVVTMFLIGMHLFHGLWSMFQSLGWNHPHYDRALRRGSMVFSAVVVSGFSSVPVAVLNGWVG